ncbi:MAG TPA: hypothetical protein VGE57_11800 [Solimonas sp.]
MSGGHPHRDPTADARLAGAPSIWAYLPWVPLYPLRPHGIAVLAMVAAFVAIGSQSLMGIPLLAITAIWMLHYLMQIVQRSAEGRATPPAMGGDVVFLDGWRTARALVGPALVTTAAGALQGGARDALWMLAAVAAPAYLFTFAFEDALRRALNPILWCDFAWRLGLLPYALACGLLAGGAWIVLTLAAVWPIWALAAVVAYLAMLSTHLLGASAALRQSALDLPVRLQHPEEVAAEETLERRIELLVLRLDAHLQAGDRAGAVAALGLEVPAHQRRRLHETMFERLLLRRSTDLLLAEGQYLMDVLLEERRFERALDVFEACDQQQAGFLPDAPARALTLAQAAFRSGRTAVLDALVERGIATWPRDVVAARLLYLQIRDLSERRGDDAQAFALLPRLLEAPEHPDRAQFEALAATLQRLTARRR